MKQRGPGDRNITVCGRPHGWFYWLPSGLKSRLGGNAVDEDSQLDRPSKTQTEPRNIFEGLTFNLNHIVGIPQHMGSMSKRFQDVGWESSCGRCPTDLDARDVPRAKLDNLLIHIRVIREDPRPV